MSPKILAAIFGLCFLTCVGIWAPFSALVGLMGLDSRGITYSRADGSLWNARLMGLAWRGHVIGDATLDVSPLSLLLGRLDVEILFDGSGPVAGRGNLTVWPNSTIALTDLTLSTNVAMLPALLPLKGSVSIDVRYADITRHGCRSADADVRTNALVEHPAGLDWSGPVLAGTVRCSEGSLIIPLTGDNGSEAIAATMTVISDGSFRIRVNARTADASVISVLSAIGFRYVDGQMTLTQSGRWG